MVGVALELRSLVIGALLTLLLPDLSLLVMELLGCDGIPFDDLQQRYFKIIFAVSVFPEPLSPDIMIDWFLWYV
jgi:hypothetical protein